jgi:glutathione S-transferase
MKLYYDPISTTSRSLMLFAAEHSLPLEWEQVSLFQEEQQSPGFLSINPNGCVPVLVDGDFVLSESSAILKFLAELAESPAYPTGLRERARVHAAMDWFLTNCHAAIGHQLVYPALYTAMFPYSSTTRTELGQAGRQGSQRWLRVLDSHMIGPSRNYGAGEDLTLADYVGGPVTALLQAVDFDLAPFPNVRRWLAHLKVRRSWDPSAAAFEGLLSAIRPAA